MMALERFCDLLDALLVNPGITIERLHLSTGINRLTLRRYLDFLEGVGFVELDGDEYDIGPRLALCLAFRHREASQ